MLLFVMIGIMIVILMRIMGEKKKISEVSSPPPANFFTPKTMEQERQQELGRVDNGFKYSRLVTRGENGKTIYLEPGERVRIMLDGNATTGYIWQTMKTEGDAMRIVNKWAYKTKTARIPGMVGVGGEFILDLEATRPGSYEIYLVYERSFEEKAMVYSLMFRFEVAVKRGETRRVTMADNHGTMELALYDQMEIVLPMPPSGYDWRLLEKPGNCVQRETGSRFLATAEGETMVRYGLMRLSSPMATIRPSDVMEIMVRVR